MAVVVSKSANKSSWKVATDVDEMVKLIGAAAPEEPRSIFFVGETHNFSYDKQRNGLLVSKLKNSKTITLVIERGMFGQDAFSTTSHPNVIVEKAGITELSSLSPKRNTEIVRQLIEFTAKISEKECKRVVVFVFGQDHEDKIQTEIEKQFPEKDRIQWSSFKSVDDQINALEAGDDKIPGNFALLGYISSSDVKQKRQELEMRLLRKGLVPNSFVTKIYAGSMLPSCSPTAIYASADTVKKYETKLYTDGTFIMSISGDTKVCAKEVTIEEAQNN